MTICFEGCNYKYETEAVMKLFLPLERFFFVYDGEYLSDISDDYTIISSKNGILSAETFLNGESRRRESHDDIPQSEWEQMLCRMLYLNLTELTGITPKWGCLTGIKPVKKVNALTEQGLSEAEAYSELKKKYFISEEKFKLAYMVSQTQEHLLSENKPNSYSLYTAIPFCPTRCAYCSFVSHSIKSAGAARLIPEYTDKLCTELEMTAKAARDLKLSLDTIYIGGGTPTAIPAESLEKIMKKIAECFDISAAREYTVEAGRADTITEEKLRIIKDCGATRISVNPQSMVNSVLRAVGRQHTAEQVEECFERARKIGFDNINMDTIAGLPTDTAEGFAYTIDKLISLDPEAITVHTLTVKRSADLFARSDEVKKCVSPAIADERVSYAQKILTEKGYNPYYLYRQKNTVGNLENVGYAKKGCESLYNIYIMDETQNILAAGASGSTKLIHPETGHIRRIVNYKYPYEYISRFDKMIEKKLSGLYSDDQ